VCWGPIASKKLRHGRWRAASRPWASGMEAGVASVPGRGALPLAAARAPSLPPLAPWASWRPGRSVDRSATLERPACVEAIPLGALVARGEQQPAGLAENQRVAHAAVCLFSRPTNRPPFLPPPPMPAMGEGVLVRSLLASEPHTVDRGIPWSLAGEWPRVDCADWGAFRGSRSPGFGQPVVLTAGGTAARFPAARHPAGRAPRPPGMTKQAAQPPARSNTSKGQPRGPGSAGVLVCGLKVVISPAAERATDQPGPAAGQDQACFALALPGALWWLAAALQSGQAPPHEPRGEADPAQFAGAEDAVPEQARQG